MSYRIVDKYRDDLDHVYRRNVVKEHPHWGSLDDRWARSRDNSNNDTCMVGPSNVCLHRCHRIHYRNGVLRGFVRFVGPFG